MSELQYLTTPEHIKQELEKELQLLQAHISSTSHALHEVVYQKQRIQEAVEYQERQNAKYSMQLHHLEELKARYAEQQEMCIKNEARVKQTMSEVHRMAQAHVKSLPISVQDLEKNVQARDIQAAPSQALSEQALPEQALPEQALPKQALSKQAPPKQKSQQALQALQAQAKQTKSHPIAQALAPELSAAQALIKDILVNESKRLRAEGKNPADHGMHLPSIKSLTTHASHLFPQSNSRKGLFRNIVHHIPGVLHKKAKDHNFVYYVL